MRWTASVVVACLAAFAATVAPAFGATNGMLAAVAEGRVVTLNPDGSGVRTLWTAPAPGELSGLAWAPDGTRLAFSYAGRILIFDLSSGALKELPNSGTRDVDPAWSPDGRQLTYRRVTSPTVQETVTFDFDGRPARTHTLDPPPTAFAWAPDSTPEAPKIAWTVGSSLFVTPMGKLELRTGVLGTPAWSPDGKRVAYVAQDNGIDGAGLFSDGIGSGSDRVPIAPLPASAPRWAPDGKSIVYVGEGGRVWIVAATVDGARSVVPGLANVTAVDWQPCVPGAFGDCVSYSPPACSPPVLTITTQSGEPKDLPLASCANPGGLALSYVVTKPPANGSINGLTYTPAPGFVGQDEVVYRAAHRFGESEPITVRIFVVRPPAPPSATVIPNATVKRPPYLTARAVPRLDRKRTARVKLACDQACSFSVRLTATLKRPKRTLRSKVVKRRANADVVVSLRLRLPRKPKGKFKSIYLTGTVRNAAGEARPVKLPVRLPR